MRQYEVRNLPEEKKGYFSRAVAYVLTRYYVFIPASVLACMVHSIFHVSLLLSVIVLMTIGYVSSYYLEKRQKELRENKEYEARTRAKEEAAKKIWQEIDKLVGLEPVKKFLVEVEAVINANNERKRRGMPPITQSLHMVFTGNPGTGKTTIARLVGELLRSMGALPSGHLIETDRSGLVAGYIGHTALKTMDVIGKAMGGVLFIDEAYALARQTGTGNWDFGSEALDTIVKAMEDHRDKLVIIFAGYRNEMQRLFDMNPGLHSRIGFFCDFPDYTPQEMLALTIILAGNQYFRLSEEAKSLVLNHYENIDIGEAGNGRYARKLVEQAMRKAAVAGRIDTLHCEDFA